MKISVVYGQNIYSNNFKTKPISFGHYSGDEKYSKKQYLAYLDSQILNVDLRLWSDEYNFSCKSSLLDDEIENAERDLTANKNRAANLQCTLDIQKDKIRYLESEGNNLQNKAQNNNTIIEQLEITKQKTIEQINQANNKLQEDLTIEFQTLTESLKEGYEQSEQIALNGIKNSLIRKVINPIIKSSEGDKAGIPSGIYIEDELNMPEPLFSWMVKQTGSNYAKLDTLNLNDEKQIVSLIRKISILAARKYEEAGKRTFTLLGNLEQAHSISGNELFKDLLRHSEELYHNIIVLISKAPYSEVMKIINFDTNLKVEKTFSSDQKFGRNSLTEFISKHQYAGENLLSKIIKK